MLLSVILLLLFLLSLFFYLFFSFWEKSFSTKIFVNQRYGYWFLSISGQGLNLLESSVGFWCMFPAPVPFLFRADCPSEFLTFSTFWFILQGIYNSTHYRKSCFQNFSFPSSLIRFSDMFASR